MNTLRQTIRLKLENKGLPADVAAQAAELIAPVFEEDGTNLDSVTAKLLLQSFIASYASFPGEALEMLKQALITGNTNKHIEK